MHYDFAHPLEEAGFQMTRKEELLAILGKYGLGDSQYKSAQAELDILMAQEYLALLQKVRENLYEVLAELNTQIVRFREVVDRAAADRAETSRGLVRWTKILAFATGGLVLATIALVLTTVVRH